MKRILILISIVFILGCQKKDEPQPIGKYGYRIIQDSENKPNDTVYYNMYIEDLNYNALIKFPLNRSVDTFMTFYSNSDKFEIKTIIEKNNEGYYTRHDTILAPNVYIEITNAHVNYFIEYKSF